MIKKIEGKYLADDWFEKLTGNTMHINNIKFNVEEYLFYKKKKLRIRVQMVNGVKHGSEVHYYENGKIHREIENRDGVKHGVQKEYHPIDKKRMLTKGNLKRFVPFVKGKKEGIEAFFIDQLEPNKSVLHFCKYKDGVKHGFARTVYKGTNNLKTHFMYKDGVKHGTFVCFDKKGEEVSRKKYFKGKEVVIYKDTYQEEGFKRAGTKEKTESKP